VKRVVGLPGEEIEIRDGEIYVNGEHVKKPEAMTEKIVPYGVVQQDRLGRYVLTEPPGQNGPGSNYEYAPINAVVKIVDGRLQVNDRDVLVTDLLRGDDLELQLADDGKTVYMKGVYYFNAPEKQRCQYETWEYRINLLDFHFWRIPETQGREFGGPYAAGLKGVTFNVPPGHYLMLGDNSGRSYDSRAWGFVPYENIKGKVFAIWMPPSRWGLPR
jgi:signal peptidase I